MKIQITKYDSLSNEELLQLAYNELRDDDDLGLELMIRLQKSCDELDEVVDDYAHSEEYWEERLDAVESELRSLRRSMIKGPQQ